MGERITLQRRSLKIEVQLSSFATFALFEKHVESKFEIEPGVQFVITDFDRESVIDDAVYSSMRSGDFWTRNPKANRLFLVLDNISAPLEGDVELEVSYQPHFNTITKTGDAHFSKIPHAVAELIDNSIQATMDNSGARTIEIEVELGGRGGSFLVVRDNGRGMNASGLKDFATYFLTQENRGVSGPQGSSTPAYVETQPSGSQGAGCGSAGGGDASSGGRGKGKEKASAKPRVHAGSGITKGSICSGFISKFGVGALQAGFYIGSCLMVVTKTARLPDVCEFVMNEAEFERRAETNSAMFRDKIKQRNPGKGREGPEAERNGPSKELLDRLRAEEIGKSHFTYIVLTLRDQHVAWFANNEKGSLQRELASIYHYYLHPENCPDGIRRDDELSEEDEGGGPAASGQGGGDSSSGGGLVSGGGSPKALEITYTRRTRAGQAADVVRLGDIKDDVESRLNTARKESFLFHMEILHPMQNPRDDTKRLPVTVRSLTPDANLAEHRRVPVTGVIHYYPYDGEKETRPQVRPDEEDDESITIEAFWEGRLVPESHAASLSFFPPQKLNKKDRETLGTLWRRRIKGMLFFDWNFPISNNKLKLQFLEGDLHTALNSSYVQPKHPAVIYPGVRGRNIQKEFREWLIKCHETLDIEYRFDDKMPTPANFNYDKWRKMTFGKGGATFMSESRVKLPFMKPNVYGVINFFRTEVDDDDEEGRRQGMFSLQRCPPDIFGDDDTASKLYPVTELDPNKSLMNDADWGKAMSTLCKQLPNRTNVIMTGTERSLPKRLTIRTGKADSTKVRVQILDGCKRPMVQIPQGKGLRVISILEREHDGEAESVFSVIAKPFSGKQYDKMYFFEAMNIKEPGEYKWTVAVAKEGTPPTSKADWLLKVVCHITVLPGNPVQSVFDFDGEPIPLGDPCWLPSFAVKLRDVSKCVCPMRSYKSVTVSCSEPGAFDISYKNTGSATHEMSVGKAISDAAGPLEYDDRCWKLVPKQTGLLSAAEYQTRAIEFEVATVAHMQQDRQQDDDEKVFTNTLDVTFQPGKPTELVLLSPVPDGNGALLVADAGSGLPPFSLGAMDAGGNRTAPAHDEAWQVSLEITAANVGEAAEKEPELAGTIKEKVAAGAATFNDCVVKWHKPLKADGELAVVDAVLRVGTNSKDRKQVASASFSVRVMPSKVPFRAVVCLDGNAWPPPGEAERAPAAGTGAAKAADAVGVRRSYAAGGVISGLHLRLYDQGGSELAVSKDTFDASNKEAVTCSWDAAWRWPAKDADKGLFGYDSLPDLKVPTQLSRLDHGIHHAKVVVTPRAVGRWPLTPLPATFAFAVHAGPVAGWSAVKNSPGGSITDNVGPLELTSGDDAKACHEAFFKVVRGFIPVDSYGNVVKVVPRAPEIRIEGMPLTKLMPEHQCKLMKPTKTISCYHFPRSLNLEGPPGQSGHILIMSSGGEEIANRGAPAAVAGDPGSAAGGSNSIEETRVLRIPVSIKAGPPVKVLIRSPKLGVDEFSSEIRTTQLSGFKVSDLEIHLVDRNGFPAHIDPKGVRVLVTPRDSLPTAVGSPRGKKNSSSAKKDLSKRATHDPLVTMPRFSLDLKVLGEPQRLPGGAGAGGGGGGSASPAKSPSKVDDRAARRAKEGVALLVRAEASDLEIAGATIYWTRQRTCAVTKVNLAALTPLEGSTSASAPTLQEPALLASVIGQRARRTGIIRPVDGPLPSLVVWLDTDNDSPCEPPPESIAITVTAISSPAGSRAQGNLFKAPVMAPSSVGKPHAMIFHPKKDVMDQNVGEHSISCAYVERRPLVTQITQEGEEERVVEMGLRVVAGAPLKLEPMAEDANLFHSLSASNQMPMGLNDDEAKHARQLVEKTFRFTANDCRGNLAGPIKGPVRMRIENLDGVDVPALEMPRLEESNADGYVLADPTATGLFLFEESWLQPGVGSREGDYKLVVDSGGDPGLQPWSTKFHFETDEKRLSSIREVKARLKPLEDKVDRFNAACHAASSRMDSALGQASDAAKELPPSLTSSINLGGGDYPASIAEAKRLLETLEAEQRGRQTQQARPMKFEQGRMRPEDEMEIRPVGYIVQLGYVQDEYRAKLLSQKGGTKMKAVYVDTKEQLDMVRRARFGGFCQETVANFRVPGENRPRNAAEIASKQLPLRALKDKGFMGYLANMIELPDDQEHLRDTVFSALYGSMVMFDTHDNAHAYQVRCKRSSLFSLPILVEEDGASLERNGYMPPAKDPDSLNKLKTVYGAMPPHLRPDYVETERYIKRLKHNLIPALEQVLDAASEVEEVDGGHDADRWRGEIATLTKELNDLMARGTPARKGGGERGSAKGAGQSARANGGGGGSSSNANRKRSSSGGGGASGGKASKKKKISEAAAAASGGRPAKRSRRSG